LTDFSKNSPSDKPDSLWHSHREKIAWFILVLDLIITVLFWNSVKNAVYQDALTRFSFRAEGIRAALEERMITYEQVLRGGVGFFEASNKVTRAEWKKYVETLQINKSFPGIQGIGFSLRIAPEDLDKHIQKIRAEGFPQYKIRPEGEREEYTSIIYLEPFTERNKSAFGYDMFSQSVRRTAMEKARDTGDTAISGKVVLVQETEEDVQSGVLVYLPLYNKGLPLETLEQLRTALKGYVYSPFRIKDLMHGILGPRAQDIAFEVYDGNEISEASMMYDSHGVATWKENSQGSGDNIFHMFAETKILDLYGHRWSLRLVSLPQFEASAKNHQSTFVLILGGLFSALCFFVIHGAFTTRRQAIQEANEMSRSLKTNEERLSFALEGTNEGLWDWNVQTGEVFFSHRWKSMLGYEPHELEGHVNTWEKIVHPDDKQWVMDVLKEHLDGKSTAYETEHRVKTKSGEYIWILDRGKVIHRDGNGEPLRATGTHTDITERKKVEEELIKHQNNLEDLIEERTTHLKKSQSKMMHMEKLSALGKLTGSIAHEFNNPIYGMKTLLENISDEAKLDEEHSRFLDIAIKECDRMANLVHKLQGFYKPSLAVKGPESINHIIENVLTLTHKKIQVRHIILKKHLSENLPEVHCVGDQIQQVLLNIVQNAEESIPEGNSGGEIVITTKKEGTYVNIIVEDSGCGISTETMRTIFDPFFTTKPDVKGTGLGLSVSHGIIKDHGGEIRVDSKINKGTTFTVVLPIE
jgi:PAS domain S-box-containing protein